MPLVPTEIEAGFPQLALSPTDWTVIVAPIGTPTAIVKKLNAASNESLHAPEIRERIEKNGGVVKIASRYEFAAHLAVEVKKWPACPDSGQP